MLNLSVVLEDSARRYPNKIAVIFGDARITYGELEAAASEVAAGLAERGVGAGDKVALSCPNLPYFPIVYYGILKAGAVVVPLNVLLKGREIAYHLADSDAKAFFCFEGNPELPMGAEGAEGFGATPSCELFFCVTADPAAPSPLPGATTLRELMAAGKREDKAGTPSAGSSATSADDTAVILYTSGTTGQPKGAELTHANLLMNARCNVDLLGYRFDDVALIVLPLFHSFGQVVQLNTGALVGMTSVLLPRFEPSAALRTMKEHSISVFCGVPTMYWALLNAGERAADLDSIRRHLRLCVSGGASLPIQVLRDFESKFEVPILEGYGLSESSPVACFNHLDRERKPGSIGTPIWGVEMKVVGQDGGELPPGEPGEILIRGHNVMKGYFNRPEATRETIVNGWLHTGDVGTMDEDGYFYIVDRTKDMIIRGGFNVYPREIEELLIEHPEVSLVAVIGVPCEEHGEEIKAFVVPAEGTSPKEPEIISWSKERLAAYKYPRQVEIREALPMTATGKILKRELKA